MTQKEQFIKMVNESELNTEIDISHYLNADTVIFHEEKDGYIWQVRESYRNIFPLKSRWYVKHYKTEKGMKRNFIRNYIERLI